MLIPNRYHSYIIFTFLFIFCLLSPSTCLFRKMKKISNNEDYLVILDNGLYIYNFEKSKHEIIFIFNQTIFEDNDKNNHIIISNNETDNKIAVLINHHLFIYSYGNSVKNIEYILIERLMDNEHLTQPFNILIDNFKLIIDLIKIDKSNDFFNDCSKNYLKTFIFENYRYINNEDPKIIEYNLYNSCEQSCQFDFFSSSIKCIIEQIYDTCLRLLTIKKQDNNYEKISEEEVHESGLKRTVNYFYNVTFTFAQKMDLICYKKNVTIECYYKNNTNGKFTKINYNNFVCNALH